MGNKNKETFYYLDPHYVKNSITDFDDKNLEKEYFKGDFLEIDYRKMNSCVSMFFLIKDNVQFCRFWKIINNLEQKYKTDFFLSVLNKQIDLDSFDDKICYF